jgi:T5SS/PEP-CTERM-associated repeat protein
MANDGANTVVGNQNTTVIDGNNSRITAGNGNDTLTAGTGSSVAAGNGADNVTVGGNSSITVGNGNDTLTAGASSTVSAGNGNDSVTGGTNSSITAGNGNDTITAGAGSTVRVGNGNDSITVGANSTVTAGNGNDTVTAGANSTITVGNGNDTVYLGTNDHVTVGNGKDTFVLPSSGQLALSAPQNASVTEDGSIALAITVTESGFSFGNEVISGFNTSNDKIQVTTAEFANFTAIKAAATQVGNNTVITADSADSIVLQNVKLTSLTAGDFVFTGPTGSNVTVTISGIPSGVTLTDAAGPITVTNGSVTLTQAQLAGLTLKAGEVTSTTLTVTANDGAGNTVTKTIALSVNPVAPTLTAPATLTVSAGASIAFGITETPFDIRDTVSLKMTGVPADATLSAGTHNADGSWTLTPAELPNLMLNAGSATSVALTVTATNTLGQTASTTASIQLNIVTPLKVTFDAVSITDTGVQGDHLTNNGSVTFSGTLTDSVAVSEVQVFNAGTPVGIATVDNVHHTWSLTTTLGEGTYSQLTATATDTSHNTSSASTNQFVKIDTTAPALVSQSESVSGLTQSKVDVITVSATDANGVASVALYDDATGQKLGDATLSQGTWSFTATGLADGAHNFYAVITDNAGNQTATADLSTVTVDTTGPAATIAASISGPTKVTSDTITVSATDANGVASVAIYDDATGQKLGNASHDTGSTWTYTAPGLADGTHNFHALVTDNAGNQSTTGEVSVLVDTVAPNVTFDAVSYDQTGTPGFSKDGYVTFSGSTSDTVTVSQVQIFNGSQFLGTANVDNVNHTWSVAETLSQGTYANLSAVATDEVGNSSSAGNTSTTQSLQIDTTAPSVTMNAVSFADTGVQGDGITDDSLVTMSGSVTDDVTVSQVQVFSGSNLLGNAVVDNSAHTWTFSGNLADGTYQNFHAVATDEAGNATPANNTSATQSVEVDTAAPAITFDNVTLAHPANGSSSTTNDGQITFSGAVSDNVSVAQIQVFDGTQLLGTATVGNGTWSLSTQLGVGSYHELHATAIDEAGNSSDAGSQNSVNVTPAAGYVADGYIQGATVFADSNGNGQLDAGEASGTTDATGHFVLGPGSTTGTLVMSGGTDTATNLPFTGVLTAPTGSTQVTPLTTLVQAVAAANGGNVAAASQSVATALGLNASTDFSNLDTVATAYQGNSDAFVAASKVLNTVSMVASAVSGAGATDFSTAASSTFSALANQIVANGTLDLNSSSVVTAVVNDTLTSVSPSSSLTSNQTDAIATVVTSVNHATDQAVADSSGAGTAALLTNVSATSIVAQGSTSSQLQQATSVSGSIDLSTVVANNTGSNLSSSVDSAVHQVGNVAPAPPTVLGLIATNSSPNNLNQVHYLLSFSDPVTGVNASDFNIATAGLTGASIASITPVAGSNGTQYDILINAGTGDGTLTLNFTGTTVQDVAQNPLQDQATHTGPTYTIDRDANEQASLALAVNSQVNTAGSAAFNFTVSGLDSDDTGTVTFTDGQNQVTVNVTGSQTTYAANLSSLTDGPITSVLSVNTDPAGNPFAPVAGKGALSVSGFNTSNSGVNIIQSGSGDIAVVGSRSIVAQSGHGILAEVSAGGSGNIVVNATGSVSGSGACSDGILAMNLNAANGGNVTVTATGGVSGTQNAIQASTNGTGTVSVHAGGNINATGQPVTGQGQFGIRAINDGTGSISLVTDAGTVINSGGEGVSVVNRNTNIPVNANASITATVNGTVNFGSVPNPSGSPAKGIDIGFFAGGNDNPNVHGTVVLNNNANVTQTVGNGGNAVTAYSYGDGSVTLNEGAGTVVSAGQIGVAALGLSAGNSFTGGANDVIVNVGDNARITGIASFGLQAYDSGDGNVSLTTGNGDIINGGSDGILASNSAKSVSAGHTITVNVGTDTVNSSTRFGINAGYNPANASAINVANGNGNVHGDVFLTSNATVTAVNNAVNGFNWGTGNVTVVTGSASSENSSTASGIFAGAFDGGNVSLTNGGSATGKTGLTAQAAGSGNITIENDGTATGTQFSGITVNQNAAGATGSTTITNTGTVTGTGNSSAINVNENATGTVTFNNSGTIGPAVINSSTNGFTVNGGSQITINNTGHINGHIVTGANGVIAANTTINNQAGAVWQTSFVTDEGTIVATGSTISVFSQPGNGMVVGNTGNAHLTLQAGAVMTANFLNVAQQVGSSGTVLVTGAGTAVNTTGQFPNIVVGQDGTASLTIADQAVVNTTNMSVGVDHQNGVTDTLIVDHATLNSTNGISIGEVGTANATVENGGAVHVGFISLGDQATGVASLTIDGAGSVVTANGLNLGVSGGSATVTVSHGGAVDIGLGTTTVADAVHVGNSASLQGSGTINGNVVDDGNVAATTGMLDITGAVTGSGSLSIAAGAHLEVSSSVSSTATVIFQGATGSLVLDHAAGQTINFSGFTGDGTLSGSNQIDLKDINYNSASFSETFDQATNTVTVSDGTKSTTLHFAGNYVAENFKFTSDGANGTIVYDPPVPSSTPAIGGAPSVGTSGFNFADHASPIVQTAEHVLADIIKPDVAAIRGLLGGFAGNGTTASLIDHLAAAADGQLGDKTILSHHDFHLS